MIGEWIARFSTGVWQGVMLPLVFFGGVYFTAKSRGVQFFRFKEMLRTVFGSVFQKRSTASGSVTPFQALTTALAGTVGTGSIVGSCQAVAMGGYGAVFWMIVAAFLGMVIKFFEVTLAVHFRRKNAHGDLVGGPMYYILYGMKKGRPLAALFSLFAVFASFGMGNLAQANSISSAALGIAKSFTFITPREETHLSLAVGVTVALLLAISIFGGIRRIGKVSEGLVPGMCLLFLILALGVLFVNARFIPETLSRIVKDAFTFKAVGGAGTGIGAKLALEWGLKRSAFSNEAGLGSSTVAHAAADTDHPVKQGFFGIFEVFADTVVISVITCLAVLVSIPDETIFSTTTPDAFLITRAFSSLYGNHFAALFIGISLVFFAFSTLLGWSLTGRRCVEFLLGEKAGKPYQILFILLTALGAVFPAENIWTLSDLFNGLIAIPNFIALFSLKDTVLNLTKDYFSQTKISPHQKKKFDISYSL